VGNRPPGGYVGVLADNGGGKRTGKTKTPNVGTADNICREAAKDWNAGGTPAFQSAPLRGECCVITRALLRYEI
jgi:hypothetical protein